MIPIIDVNLDRAPGDRWRHLAPQAPTIRAMLGQYLRDLQPVAEDFALSTDVIQGLLLPDEWAEIEGLASAIDMPFEEVLLGNLYYDALKHIWGCTAFAVDTPTGPIHGRNLDWFTENGALARHTVQFRFVQSGRERYRTVSWPGFIGCLSGMAPRRFAVTLNTVWSSDPAELATPVSLLLRRTLADAPDFRAAVHSLSETPVGSDSLLLVSGVSNGEMAVVERSPRRSAVRLPKGGAIVVTNDYHELNPGDNRAAASELATTSCGRFERCSALAKQGALTTLEDALPILTDGGVQMGCTVQHMAFQAATGEALVALPLLPH